MEMITELTQFGSAGIMGARWLWERRASTTRERQLDEAHQRIVSDTQVIQQLVELVRQNTQALTRLSDRLDVPEGPPATPPCR